VAKILRRVQATLNAAGMGFADLKQRGKRAEGEEDIETERRKLKNVVLAKIEEGKIKFI